GAARETSQHAADDRGAGTRHARIQRRNRRYADPAGVGPARTFQRTYGRRTESGLDGEDDQSADDQGRRHVDRGEKMLLDPVVEKEADGSGGQKRETHFQYERACVTVVQRAPDQIEKRAPIMPYDRQDRAELNEDLEGRSLGFREIDDGTGNDQMTGRRDRQKLGDTLDDAEDQCLHQQRHDAI